MKPGRACELCKGEASVYCEADSAFLCWACDARVHGANFLVARHVRRIVCSESQSLDADRRVSGDGSLPIHSICQSCASDGPDLSASSSSSSSSSSSCISTAESTVATTPKKDRPVQIVRPRSRRGKVDARADGILVNWASGIGLKSGRCVGVASHVMSTCWRKMTVLPFRVFVAASLWYSIKLCEDEGVSSRTCGMLKRLEVCSGVPAKLIVVAESRLSRVAGRRSRVVEEGWAECS